MTQGLSTREVQRPRVLGVERKAALRRDAADLMGTAHRKGLTMDSWSIHQEREAIRDHFDLGCELWLHVHGKSGLVKLEDRLDCVRRLFEAGIGCPGYRFFTVFDFGERQFDGCFEMGDSDEMVSALLDLAAKWPGGKLAECVKSMGWGRRKQAQADLFEG